MIYIPSIIFVLLPGYVYADGLSCLVMRPGYGLVSEQCPESAVGCRIRVQKDHIEWYQWARLYDRNQLVCVYPEEYAELSGCQRKASGSVRCWCGGDNDCNDAENSKLLYANFVGKAVPNKWKDRKTHLKSNQIEDAVDDENDIVPPSTTIPPSTSKLPTRKILVKKIRTRLQTTTKPPPTTTSSSITTTDVTSPAPISTEDPTTPPQSPVARIALDDFVVDDAEKTTNSLEKDDIFAETRKKLEKEMIEENARIQEFLQDEEEEMEEEIEETAEKEREEEKVQSEEREKLRQQRRERAREVERRRLMEEEKLARMEREEAEQKMKTQLKTEDGEGEEETEYDYGGFGYTAHGLPSACYSLVPAALLLIGLL